MKLHNYREFLQSIPEETKEEIKVSMDILERIHELIETKFDGKQKLLADRLGKSEAEVSKWVNGVQNFTIRTLSKLQVAFGEQIIAVCTNSDKSTFVQVKAEYKRQHQILEIGPQGLLHEKSKNYSDIRIAKITPKEDCNILPA